MSRLAEQPHIAVKGPGNLPGFLTYPQFLDWLDEDKHAEWVDGEVRMMAPIGDAHQVIGVFLLRVLSEYAEAKSLGEIRHDPFQMKTGPRLPGRAPDILFIAKKNLSRLKKTHLQGPADLVVEIISPESAARDRGEKYFEYEEGGVPEYWLIDPDRRTAEFYQRDRKGIYQLAPLESNGVYRSKAMQGLWINVTWLWQRPLPALKLVRRAWKIR